jgi:hypothetical protein
VCLDSQDLQIIFSEAAPPSLTMPGSPTIRGMDQRQVGVVARTGIAAYGFESQISSSDEEEGVPPHPQLNYDMDVAKETAGKHDKSYPKEGTEKYCESQGLPILALSRQESDSSSALCSVHTVSCSSLFNSTGGWRLPRVGSDVSDDASFASTLSSESSASSSSSAYGDGSVDLIASAGDSGGLRLDLFGSRCSFGFPSADNNDDDGSSAASAHSRSSSISLGSSEVSKQLEKWSEMQACKYERTLAAIVGYQNRDRVFSMSSDMPFVPSLSLVDVALPEGSEGFGRDRGSSVRPPIGSRCGTAVGTSRRAPLPAIGTVSSIGAGNSWGATNRIVQRCRQDEAFMDIDCRSVYQLVGKKKRPASLH